MFRMCKSLLPGCISIYHEELNMLVWLALQTGVSVIKFEMQIACIWTDVCSTISMIIEWHASAHDYLITIVSVATVCVYIVLVCEEL
jgi:hypothetical protein